eukprot:1541430-Rhodomonas_salina.1
MESERAGVCVEGRAGTLDGDELVLCLVARAQLIHRCRTSPLRELPHPALRLCTHAVSSTPGAEPGKQERGEEGGGEQVRDGCMRER